MMTGSFKDAVFLAEALCCSETNARSPKLGVHQIRSILTTSTRPTNMSIGASIEWDASCFIVFRAIILNLFLHRQVFIIPSQLARRSCFS
jgi:hypothetical protein